jgi:hypothetical protein
VSRGKASGVPSPAVNFLRRPDLSVLSEAIPLFYIAQNKLGFWVAREAEGRGGGVFFSGVRPCALPASRAGRLAAQ